MWNKLTTLGKLLVILTGLLPFFIASHFIGNNYALTGIIFISSLIFLFLVITFGAAIIEHNREREMERERERDAHNRVILNFNNPLPDPPPWQHQRINPLPPFEVMVKAPTRKNIIKRVFTKEDPYGEENWNE